MNNIRKVVHARETNFCFNFVHNFYFIFVTNSCVMLVYSKCLCVTGLGRWRNHHETVLEYSRLRGKIYPA